MVITTHQKEHVEVIPEAQGTGPITRPQNTETRVVMSLAMGGGGGGMLVYLHSIHAPMLPSYACVVLFAYSLSQYATLPQPVM